MGFDLMVAGYTTNLSGVISVSVGAPGSGGTNGTYDIVPTGGGGTDGVVRVTVASGAISAVRVAAPGNNYTTTPTLDLSSIPGLTGASVTLTQGAYKTRSSWDPMSAYIAVMGIGGTQYTRMSGTNAVDASTGSNTYAMGEPGQGRHTYTFPRLSNTAMATAINRLL